MDILRAAARHTGYVAVKTSGGRPCSYGKLLETSESIQKDLTKILPAIPGPDGPRVGIYAEPGVPYVAATWATWMAGGVAVPLAVSHPPHELDYVIRDAGISAVLTPAAGHDKLKDVAHAAGAALHLLHDGLFESTDRFLTTDNCSSSSSSSSSSSNGSDSNGQSSLQQAFQQNLSDNNNHIGSQSNSKEHDAAGALMIYTSGTTGRPKGALHTHGSLGAMADCLSRAWAWQPTDVILHSLPLHHIHGIVNALYCAHYVGAAVHFLPRFSPSAMWRSLQSGDISVLMAVPTMYSYLLSHYDSHMTPEEQAAARSAAAALRLTVSGSAAAPVPLLQRWKALSGQQLLERYGMTETGMILSNPYEGERRAGFVGLPLPGVEVKVVPVADDAEGSGHDGVDDDDGNNDDDTASAQAALVGELAVRGSMLFQQYWGRPEATASAFDADGFFLTGDTVSLEGNPPYYRILGRSSVDIIKSGGYKISALDIESALLHHPSVAEAAVLGVADDKLGQVVTALIYPKEQQQAALADGSSNSSNDGNAEAEEVLIQELKQLCRTELAQYSVPRRWKVLQAPLPRNAMGKVNKKELLKTFFSAEATAAATSL